MLTRHPSPPTKSPPPGLPCARRLHLRRRRLLALSSRAIAALLRVLIRRRRTRQTGGCCSHDDRGCRSCRGDGQQRIRRQRIRDPRPPLHAHRPPLRLPLRGHQVGGARRRGAACGKGVAQQPRSRALPSPSTSTSSYMQRRWDNAIKQ